MISLRDVVTGFGNRDPLAEVWRRNLRGGSAEITGVPPLRYIGDGRPLTDYMIYGNTVQDGTPSPDAPVDATGSGVRTGNLYDGEYEQADRSLSDATGLPAYTPERCYSHKIAVNASMRLVVTQYPRVQYGVYSKLFFYDENDNYLGAVTAPINSPATPPENASYCRFCGHTNNRDKYMVLDDPPTTITEYIPYGYKLPLTVNGTEYPIYLGAVPTTRRVKKLVLTGEENVTSYTGYGAENCFYVYKSGVVLGAGVCNFYSNVNGLSAFINTDNSFMNINGVVRIHDGRFASPDDFKAWLAAQYTAGTPVTVWYVLAEPETAVVNEPLMKIGDYADTISFAQSQVTIPTVSGTNVLDVPTTVPPSQITIKGGISSV